MTGIVAPLTDLCAATVYWDMQTATPAGMVAAEVAGGILSGYFSLEDDSASAGYTGASGNNNASMRTSTSVAASLTWTLTAAGEQSLMLSGISFGSRVTATGPSAWSLSVSVDGGASLVWASGISASVGSWALMIPDVTGPLSGSSFVFVLASGNGSSILAENWRLDDMTLTYTSSVVPEPSKVLLLVIAVAGFLGLRRRGGCFDRHRQMEHFNSGTPPG